MTSGPLRRQTSALFRLPKGNPITRLVSENICALGEKRLECGKHTNWVQLSKWNLPAGSPTIRWAKLSGQCQVKLFSSDPRKDLKMETTCFSQRKILKKKRTNAQCWKWKLRRSVNIWFSHSQAFFIHTPPIICLFTVCPFSAMFSFKIWQKNPKPLILLKNSKPYLQITMFFL